MNVEIQVLNELKPASTTTFERGLNLCFIRSNLSLVSTGMTVEVLGSVLGTAIQGQIVGKVNTPCIPDPPFLNTNNSSVVLEEVNITRDTGSLSDTVWMDPYGEFRILTTIR